MFMFLNKKVIASIFSTLFVTSRGYADTASLSTEEKIRELDSSCSCEFSDIIGSDFSCLIDSVTFHYEIPNFGEEGSVWSFVRADGSTQGTLNFVSSSASEATYVSPFNSIEYYIALDPTVEENGECLERGYTTVFGCWACPATPSPTFFPTDSPSNQPTEEEDDEINDDIVNTGSDDTEEEEEEEDDDDDDEDDTAEDDEECYNCGSSLFFSLKKLFLVGRVDSIPE